MGKPEVLAESVLGLLPGVEVTPTDVPGAPPSTCDLLVTAATRTWAVEVTRSMDPGASASWGAAGKRDWELPGLRRCWTLVVDRGFHSKRIRDAAAEGLPGLESLGMFVVPQPRLVRDSTLAGPLSVLWLAGVTLGTSYPAPSGVMPWMDIATSGPRSAPSSDLARSLQAEVDKTDNRRKLRESGADERHLFVWVEDDSSYPAMHDCDTEGVSVELPPEIDVLWAARTLRGDWPITHLWRVSRGGAWDVVYRYGRPVAV